MANVLLWTGKILIGAGWLALAWQAAKTLSRKAEIEKFPALSHTMLLRRNYCRLAIIAGILLILISLML